MHFHEWKILCFGSNFTEVCSQGSNKQFCSVGSGNGLAPDRWQAITWTNADPFLRPIFVAQVGDELTDIVKNHVLVVVKQSWRIWVWIQKALWYKQNKTMHIFHRIYCVQQITLHHICWWRLINILTNKNRSHKNKFNTCTRTWNSIISNPENTIMHNGVLVTEKQFFYILFLELWYSSN